jgi:pyruvate-formate lyase-activating enzyme
MHFSLREKLLLMQSAARNMSLLLGATAIDPSLIVWLMTYKCNLACRHCNYWQKAVPIDPQRTMRAAEMIAATRTPIVVLSGGEPLIVPASGISSAC